jgi:hypothetical protein
MSSQISFALQRASQPAMACVEISILLFYMRIFATKKFITTAYIVMTYTILCAVVTWIVHLTVCTPIAYYYDKTIPGGTCRNQAVTSSVYDGLSLLGEVVILALPIPMVWRLEIETRKKMAICGIFLLGFL